ncbi:CREG1.2 family protein [Megaselia abdita]
MEDIRLIKAYLSEQVNRPTNHAKVARNLVHNSDWAAVGTISVDSKIAGFPMVNVISVADKGGVIYFMLVDLDFTGQDWRKTNNVTFLFTEDVNGDCRAHHKDSMEPTCARAMISGNVMPIDKNEKEFKPAIDLFLKRHPAGVHWIDSHDFYICKLNIGNIYVLDFYGGPNLVSVEDYYKASLYEEEPRETIKVPLGGINITLEQM